MSLLISVANSSLSLASPEFVVSCKDVADANSQLVIAPTDEMAGFAKIGNPYQPSGAVLAVSYSHKRESGSGHRQAVYSATMEVLEANGKVEIKILQGENRREVVSVTLAKKKSPSNNEIYSGQGTYTLSENQSHMYGNKTVGPRSVNCTSKQNPYQWLNFWKTESQKYLGSWGYGTTMYSKEAVPNQPEAYETTVTLLNGAVPGAFIEQANGVTIQDGSYFKRVFSKVTAVVEQKVVKGVINVEIQHSSENASGSAYLPYDTIHTLSEDLGSSALDSQIKKFVASRTPFNGSKQLKAEETYSYVLLDILEDASAEGIQQTKSLKESLLIDENTWSSAVQMRVLVSSNGTMFLSFIDENGNTFKSEVYSTVQ